MNRHQVEVDVAQVVGAGVVALHFGCAIHLAAEKRDGGERIEADCFFRHPAGPLAPDVERTIYAGGQIAKAAYSQCSPYDMEPEEAIEYAPDGCTLADVAFVLDLLRRRWPVIENEVATMTPQILHGTAMLH